jgi:tetratricopeptide (TPR) repeat protein
MSSFGAGFGGGGYTAPYFQADYIQDISDFSSGIVNPALLYRVDQLHFDIGFYRWGIDFSGPRDLGYQQTSFLVPIRLNQTAGLTVIGNGSVIDQVEVEDEVRPTGIDLRYIDLWFVAHYAVRLQPWFMLGANPKVVVQNQFSEPQDRKIGGGFGLDLGLYFNPLDHYRFGDLGISVTFQDLLPARVEWGEGENGVFNTMTSRFRAGVRYAAMNDRVVLDGEFVLDNALADFHKGLIDEIEKVDNFDTNDDGIPDSTAVAEFLEKQGRVSGHAKFEFIPQLWFKAGWANNNIPYIGVNVNLIYPLPEMINYASADVHIGYSLTESERGLSLMGKFATEFGPTREQRESRRLYDRLILAPMNAYNEAMRLYLAKKYWEASFAFGKVISLFPNFHLNDKATFYLGNCYRFLRLNDISREVYKQGLAEYTTSEVRPKYLYGLQNLDYREGRYEDALKNHAFITNLYADSEIRPDADYLAGQIHFMRKNYNAAEQLLTNIKPEDPTYLYAQYTLSVINIENNKMKAATQNLRAISQDTTQDPGELLLQDAANNKLGQLHFEQVELREAVESFDKVPEGSVYGDEALLGIAWSWIKVNRPEQTMRTIERLISAHPESPLIPEAYLVKGYALMLQEQLESAISALETSLEMANKNFADEDDLSYQEQQFNGFLREFQPTGQEIMKNALRKPTDRTIAERDELQTQYSVFSQKSREFFEFSQMVEDNQKFFKRKEQIVMDAEYALAKATNMLGGAKETKTIERAREESEELESEIEKLKKELEQSE